MYYFGILKNDKIRLENLTSITTGLYLVKLIFASAFVITIGYIDEHGKESSLQFLSNQEGSFKDANEIFGIKELGDIIQCNKPR